jgi:hypothetical protein
MSKKKKDDIDSHRENIQTVGNKQIKENMKMTFANGTTYKHTRVTTTNINENRKAETMKRRTRGEN